MRPIRVVALAAALAVIPVAYLYRERSQAEYRHAAIEKVTVIGGAWVELRKKAAELADRMAANGGTDDNDIKTGARIDQQRFTLRKEFYDLENELKASNRGELPQWLKDDRVWQELNRIFTTR